MRIKCYLLILLVYACKSDTNSSQVEMDNKKLVIKRKNMEPKTFKNLDMVELQDGTCVRYKVLTKNEFAELLKDVQSPPIVKSYDIKAYQLNNSNVIAQSNEDYNLYFSMSDLDKVINDFTDGGHSGAEVLMNKNKYGEAFPGETYNLIKELLSVLHLTYSPPDKMLLQRVDEAISKTDDPQTFMKEHFINLVAIVGESLIRKHNLKWEMKLGSDNSTWNPYLKARKNSINFFIYLYEDIFLNTVQKDYIMYEIYETTDSIIEFNK